MMNAPNQTRNFFHEYAGEFNSIYSNRNTPFNQLINRTFRKSMALRYRKTLERCMPAAGKRVLDLGCGPGHYTVALARKGAEALGIDFAEGMIELARQQALAAGVSERCRFSAGDFYSYKPDHLFHYVIVMGVMDYIAEPKALLARILSMTGEAAFISFPRSGGLLAWQRKLRYRSRCPLFLYTDLQIQELFRDFSGFTASIEPIARDFFVTVSKNGNTIAKERQ